MNSLCSSVVRAVVVACCLGPLAAQAQWLTQTVRLKPGWNAVFLHVDLSHTTLDDLIPNAADPVAEIWLWRPTPVTMQFLERPQEPNVGSTQWGVWTAARGDGDTLTRLIGNAAYLVRNGTATDYDWSVKGRPVPPAYQWTTTGLNLLGFPTPAGAAPTFDRFLAPAPGLDPARSTANGVEIIRYPGGDLDTNNINPRVVSPLEARTTVVTRGEAFWIRADTNYYNRYYGPVEVGLPDPQGMHFRDTVGVQAIRLKNLTSTARTVTFNLVPSEAPPAGQPVAVGSPQLLVRGARNPIDLSYGYTVLSGNTFALAPEGEEGSELEVVVGLNRAAMVAPAGSLYTAVLRMTDTAGLLQIDVPVTASTPSLAGLWVGEASVGQVGQYLKSYPRITAETPAPRASYLELDGSSSFGALPPGVPFNGASATVEAWVKVRLTPDVAPLVGLAIAPLDNPTSVVSMVSFNLTASGGRLTPNIAVPLLLDQPHVPEDGGSVTAVTPLHRDYGGTNAQGGQIISFDFSMDGAGENWAGLVLGAGEVDQAVFVAGAAPHFGLIFRANGRLQAFDGAQSLTSPEPVWAAANPTQAEHHVEIVCSDPADGNPFDGVGSTRIEVYVDGAATPVFGYTRGDGGYGANFLNFQPFSLTQMRVDNLMIGPALPVVSSVQLIPDQWTHVAFVTEAGQGRIYLNGSLVGQGGVPPGVAGVIDNGLIGGNPETSATAPAGLDDVRLWSVARSEEEIRRDMAVARFPEGTPGLMAQYDFPGTGGAGVDSSGNGWDLALVGNAVLGESSLGLQETLEANVAVAVASANRPLPGTELAGSAWVNRTPEVDSSHSAVASSLDGTRLLAAVTGAGGRLRLSADGGATWSAVGPENVAAWTGVASSGSGAILAAAGANDRVYVSADGGATWAGVASVQGWSGLAMSADGARMVGVVLGGRIHTSSNGGAIWTARESLRNWVAVASSADGRRLVAAVSGGRIYTSTDAGLTWTARATDRAWTAVASSADGMRLVAAVNTPVTGGQIYTSQDGGVAWVAREKNRAWAGVASSTDGRRLVAVATGVGVFSSTDGGVSWSAQEQGRNWRAVASSSDGARLAAVVDGGGVFTKARQFASYERDPNSGLIRAQDGSYLSTGVNTNLARTASPFPLRLLLHHDPAANEVKLLQRVYVGRGASQTNDVVAQSEGALDPAHFSSARRLSAGHLPFTHGNEFWAVAGQMRPGATLSFTVVVDDNAHTSNPFLHTFHPDHDNLQADFKRVQAVGVESYGLTREIRLTLAAPGTDFRGLTASGLSLRGAYEEVLTLGGRAGAARQFRAAGSFFVQRISPIETLTTP